MTMAGKGPNWEKTGTVVAYAEWMREKSGAFAVIVLRRDDGALAADPAITPNDVQGLINEHLPALMLDLTTARREKRKGARLELGACPE